jgi:hypothetical protein
MSVTIDTIKSIHSAFNKENGEYDEGFIKFLTGKQEWDLVELYSATDIAIADHKLIGSYGDKATNGGFSKSYRDKCTEINVLLQEYKSVEEVIQIINNFKS